MTLEAIPVTLEVGAPLDERMRYAAEPSSSAACRRR